MRPIINSGIALGCVALFFAINSILQGDAPSPSRRPILLLTGPTSQIDATEYHRITSTENWQTLWLRHHGKTAQEAFNERLTNVEIDFENHELIAIFQGVEINSRGLTIDSIIEDDDVITVRFDDWQYQSSGGADRCSTYGFVLLPKSTKPIVLEENVQGLKDEPPKWKQRARLQ